MKERCDNCDTVDAYSRAPAVLLAHHEARTGKRISGINNVYERGLFSPHGHAVLYYVYAREAIRDNKSGVVVYAQWYLNNNKTKDF